MERIEAEEMRREVELECEPERAWRAITEEEELASWLGLGGQVEAEVEPGGEIVVREPDAVERRGFFEHVEEERSLSFWWSEGGEPGRVELTIEPTDAGCLLTVVETRPLLRLERELAEIASGGATEGPVASAAPALAA